MRNRAITTQELHSKELGEVSILANLLYHHLKVNADDFGTVKAQSVGYIKAICFPNREISTKELESALLELENKGLILKIFYLQENHYYIPLFAVEQKVNNPSQKRNITKQILTNIIIEKIKSLGEKAPAPLQRLVHHYCQDYEYVTRKGEVKQIYFSESIDREILIEKLEKDVKPRPKQAEGSKETKDKPKEKPKQKESKSNEAPAYIQEQRGEVKAMIINEYNQKKQLIPLAKEIIIKCIFRKQNQYTVTQYFSQYQKLLNRDFDNLRTYIENKIIDCFMENRAEEDKKNCTLLGIQYDKQFCLFQSENHVFNAFKKWFDSQGHKLIPKR